MRFHLQLVLTCLCAATLSGSRASGQATPARAAGARADILVHDAWSRPALAGGTGVVYLVLDNNGSAVANLHGARSPVARAVEIHQSMQHGTSTMMHQMTDVAIAPHSKYTMMPGDVHFMLVGLKRALAVGDTIPITLLFTGGTVVKTAAVVRVP